MGRIATETTEDAENGMDLSHSDTEDAKGVWRRIVLSFSFPFSVSSMSLWPRVMLRRVDADG